MIPPQKPSPGPARFPAAVPVSRYKCHMRPDRSKPYGIDIFLHRSPHHFWSLGRRCSHFHPASRIRRAKPWPPGHDIEPGFGTRTRILRSLLSSLIASPSQRLSCRDYTLIGGISHESGITPTIVTHSAQAAALRILPPGHQAARQAARLPGCEWGNSYRQMRWQ